MFVVALVSIETESAVYLVALSGLRVFVGVMMNLYLLSRASKQHM